MMCVGLCLWISVWLTQHNYDPPHRNAMLRHIQIESRFQEDALAPWGSICLFQWNGVRRRQVLALGGGKCPDWDTQMAFADRELRDVPAYRCFLEARSEEAAFRALRKGFGRGHC